MLFAALFMNLFYGAFPYIVLQAILFLSGGFIKTPFLLEMDE